MLRGFLAALDKDFRLLARDRVGLVFLTLAPIVVIAVAGLSLASLYGPGPGAGHRFVLELVDEDGGAVTRALREHPLDGAPAEIAAVSTREAALARVRGKAAGAALIIPRGTAAALAEGRPASLVLLTDPVMSIEVAAARAVVQELRHRIESEARERAAVALDETRANADEARARFEQAAAALRAGLDRVAERLATARAEAIAHAAEARRRAEQTFEKRVADTRAEAERRLAAELAPLRAFLTELAARQRDFADWLARVREKAGRFADRVPPPPEPPAVPARVAALATRDVRSLVAELLPPEQAAVALPPWREPSLPPLPDLALPSLPALPPVELPGSLAIEETSVTGAPRQLNTFDQNVPGFSVTFLLLGVLLGVSLGLLDEADWGTLARLRATPTPLAAVLGAKLTARFAVGMGQMILLFAVGRVLFDVSLGAQPWALLLPTAGIVAAGTAFGLVVAGLTRSREAVLPVGSIVILTMAATGGCWWPIDLEPPWMRTVALAFPTTWAMDAYNDLMIRRQPASAALGATAVLLAYAVAYLLLGLLLFRRRLAQGT
jgi:ABC-type multidrug transport system permease subunit